MFGRHVQHVPEKLKVCRQNLGVQVKIKSPNVVPRITGTNTTDQVREYFRSATYILFQI